jgi:hypothetical protein
MLLNKTKVLIFQLMNIPMIPTNAALMEQHYKILSKKQ